MGNCGSFFVGAILAGASLVVAVRPGASIVSDGLALVLVFIVPILDTSFVIVMRRLAGRHATRGGTDHLSHRLVQLGLSERSAAATLHAIALLGGAAAWFVHWDGMSLLPVALVAVLAAILFGVYLARVPAYDGDDFKVLQNGPLAPLLR